MTNITIPKKVRIGGKTYLVDTNKEIVIHSDDSECYGNIIYDEGVINIANQFSNDHIEVTFLHECIHGIDDFMCIGLSEEQTRRLANGLYMFIKDNPVFKEGDN